MGLKYIRNTDDAMVVCRISSDKNKVFYFPAKKFDKRNDISISNGFTEISDEDLKLLEAESNVFKYYIKEGRLTITDSLPQESMSTEQLIASLKMEIATLKAQLKTASKGESSKELRAAEDTIAKLSDEINELRETMAEKQAVIDGLDAQLEEFSKAVPDVSLLAEKMVEIDALKKENEEQSSLIEELQEQISEMDIPAVEPERKKTK